jgi:type I restriction enzyme M protein
MKVKEVVPTGFFATIAVGAASTSHPGTIIPIMPRGRPKNLASDAPSAKAVKTEKHNGNGGNLLAADKLRKNLEPSDCKHVALGLIFLKYISNAFEAKRATLLAEDAVAAEDPDEYLAENVFWVPKEARWSHLQANAKSR